MRGSLTPFYIPIYVPKTTYWAKGDRLMLVYIEKPMQMARHINAAGGRAGNIGFCLRMNYPQLSRG